MMRKNAVTILLGLLIAAFACQIAVAADAINKKPSLAIVAWYDAKIGSKEKVRNMVRDKMGNTFSAEEYQLTIDDDAVDKILEFTEDEDVDDIEKIKKGQLVAFGKKNGYDYIVLLIVRPADSRIVMNFWDRFLVKGASLSAKVVDVENGKYLLRKQYAEEGKSAFGFLGPSAVNAWSEAVEKCIDKFAPEAKNAVPASVPSNM